MHTPSPNAKALLSLVAAASTALVAAAPCDIYEAAGNPCIAAHGTTRALYNTYSGPLYQVTRDSDGRTRDIPPLSPGDVANAAMQDAFCEGTTCLISKIYDQSGHNNHLTQAPPGGAARGQDKDGYDFLTSAIGAPVKLHGRKAYGVFIFPGSGYRNNNATETAIGDEAQGMYAVMDGTHWNVGCCFDYGNAEPSSLDTGNGHMETIYFGGGDGSGRGTGEGPGPWIMADLENGLFSGFDRYKNVADKSMPFRFVTGIVKGKPGTWAIRGGNGARGDLKTFYDGKRPEGGYDPMQKEGAIILGIGGDNSNWAQGTFYEGVMTKGYPSDETEDKVQADIVSQQYGATTLNSGPKLLVDSSVSFRVTTPGYDTRYIAHTGDRVNTQEVSSSSSDALKQAASWTVRRGLGNRECYSFESKDQPGAFIRHSNYELHLNLNDGTKLFGEDATFCGLAGLNGQGNSIRSWSYPTRYWRHYGAEGFIASNGGPKQFDSKTSFNDDVSYAVGDAFA